MQKIGVVGAVPSAGLGDALQYYILIALLNKFLPEADITFICPHLKEEIYVFKPLKLNAHLISTGLTGNQLLIYLLSSIPRKNEEGLKEKVSIQVDEVNPITRIMGRKSYESYILSKHLGLPIARFAFSFNAAIFGGHTLCHLPVHYITQYEILRSVVKGPMLTSPISISELALKYDVQKPSALKRLKRSLQKFDFIYVRGPYSREIFIDRLDVDEERVAMALDSGFGIKLVHPDIVPSKALVKALRVVIIPRKDYFFVYNRGGLYRSYLDALVGLILWLSRNFNADVYLASQTVSCGWISGQSAVRDVVRLLEKRGNDRCSEHLKIVKPDNFIDAYKLYSSADLVITGHMHGGIMALSAGVPALFIVPSADVKVPDVLSFLGLEVSSFLIDVFDINALTTDNFIDRVRAIIGNLKYHRKNVDFAVNKALSTVELPVKTLTKLLK